MSNARIAQASIEKFARENYSDYALGNQDREIESNFTALVKSESEGIKENLQKIILKNSITALWETLEDLAEEGLPA